jgi:hypothetical protein
MRISVVIVSLVCLCVLAAGAYADGFIPIINSATVNYLNGTITISGVNFGTTPVVKLGTTTLTVQGAPTATQIVATFTSPPLSSFAAGTYFLNVTFKNGTLAIFTLALGAIGPQGPPGMQGPPGRMELQEPMGETACLEPTGKMVHRGQMARTAFPGRMAKTGLRELPAPPSSPLTTENCELKTLRPVGAWTGFPFALE